MLDNYKYVYVNDIAPPDYKEVPLDSLKDEKLKSVCKKALKQHQMLFTNNGKDFGICAFQEIDGRIVLFEHLRLSTERRLIEMDINGEISWVPDTN